jgi:hypothetical protein
VGSFGRDTKLSNKAGGLAQQPDSYLDWGFFYLEETERFAKPKKAFFDMAFSG